MRRNKPRYSARTRIRTIIEAVSNMNMSLKSLNLNESEYSNQMRLEGKFCDVSVNVAKCKFPCHRVMLASSGKYFRGLLCGDYIETGKNEIELKGISSAADFELVLSHIYGCSISFDEKKAARLLQISNYLSIQSLEDLCVKYLVQEANNISLPGVVTAFVFASRIQNESLMETFKVPMANNFVNASKYGIFFTIPKSALLKVLNHPDLEKDASAILDFLAEWIKFQPNEDRNLFTDLLNPTLLEKVPMQWFEKVLTQVNNSASKSMVDTDRKIFDDWTTDYLLDITAIDEENNCSSQGRVNGDIPIALYVLDNDVNQCEAINLYESKGCNKDVKFMTSVFSRRDITQMDYFKAVCVDKTNYMVTASYRRRSYQPSFSFYCIPYIMWKFEEHRELPGISKAPNVLSVHAGSGLSITSSGTDIYLYTYNLFLKFNCETNLWTTVKSPPTNREHSSLVSYNDGLYLIGGEQNEGSPSVAYGKYFSRYDIKTATWSEMPMMKHAHSKPGTCAYDNVLYTSGGDNSVHANGYIEFFDFRANKWCEFETFMPKPKMGHTVLAYKNQLCFVGGQTYKWNNIMEDLTWYSYNLRERSWSDISSMPATYEKTGMTMMPRKILDAVIKVE